MPEAERGRKKTKNMSWLFSKEEEYSIHDSGFYGEPEITFGSGSASTSTSSSSSTSTSGAWDDKQHEREYIATYINNSRSR